MITLQANDTVHAQANWLRAKGYNLSQVLREHIRIKATEAGWIDPTAVPPTPPTPTIKRVIRQI